MVDTEDLVGPGALLVREPAACFPQGLSEKGTPPGDVVQGYGDSVLDEP